MKIFAIRDKKGMRFVPQLLLFENFVDAERQFNDIVNHAGSIINKYPNDFCLVFLGEFDVETGLCSLKSIPDVVHEAISFVAGKGAADLSAGTLTAPSPAAQER